ncbi:MAG: hypothetical protein PHE79_00370 [Eubacteriales bacterium]|nr:hypothetical protein [Eubacteriales bacterium]
MSEASLFTAFLCRAWLESGGQAFGALLKPYTPNHSHARHKKAVNGVTLKPEKHKAGNQ